MYGKYILLVFRMPSSFSVIIMVKRVLTSLLNRLLSLATRTLSESSTALSAFSCISDCFMWARADITVDAKLPSRRLRSAWSRRICCTRDRVRFCWSTKAAITAGGTWELQRMVKMKSFTSEIDGLRHRL